MGDDNAIRGGPAVSVAPVPKEVPPLSKAVASCVASCTRSERQEGPIADGQLEQKPLVIIGTKYGGFGVAIKDGGPNAGF